MNQYKQDLQKSYFIHYYSNDRTGKFHYSGKAELSIDGFVVVVKTDRIHQTPMATVEDLNKKIVEASSKFTKSN